jgi:hypothetical protein
METVMRELKNVCAEFWYKLYADDLVIICKQIHLRKIITNLRIITKKFSLILNEKKSAIFLLKKRKSDVTDVLGIPIVTEYKFLGIWIDNFGKIKK